MWIKSVGKNKGFENHSLSSIKVAQTYLTLVRIFPLNYFKLNCDIKFLYLLFFYIYFVKLIGIKCTQNNCCAKSLFDITKNHFLTSIVDLVLSCCFHILSYYIVLCTGQLSKEIGKIKERKNKHFNNLFMVENIYLANRLKICIHQLYEQKLSLKDRVI